MERNELVDVVETIADVYSNFRFNNMDNEERKRMLRSWYTVLGDYEYTGVQKRLTAYFKTGNKFPPSATELIPSKENPEEKGGPYVPNYEETMRYLDAQYAPHNAAMNQTEEEKARVRDIQREIERTLGIRRNHENTNA